MRDVLIVAMAAIALVGGEAAATPAPPPPALQLCTDGFAPPLDLVIDGCRVADHNDDEPTVEGSVFEATGNLVDLSLFGKSDQADAGSLFHFFDDGMNAVGDPAGLAHGFWAAVDGTLISHITFKAGNDFLVYELAAPSASGAFWTDGLVSNGGRQPAMSHISFWTTGSHADVPEPANLAIMGFGLLGLGWARKRA